MIKKNKKLLIIIWEMGLGGIQKRVRDIILEINTNHPNWEIHLLLKFEKPDYFLADLKNCKNLHTHSFKKTQYQRGRSFPLWWIAKPFFVIKPDVCLTFLEYLSVSVVIVSFLMSWRKKTKVVLNEGILTSKYLQLNKDIIGRRPYRLFIRMFYRFAHTIIVPTKEVKNDLINFFKVPGGNIITIPNWTLFKPKVSDRKLYDFIYIARFEEEKNPMLFLEIIDTLKDKYPQIKACLIGEGSLKSKILKFSQEKRLAKNVDIFDYQKNPQPFLLNSKIFLMTSKNEGMPNVVLEAGISSLPTITTPFRGVGEVVIDGETGFICHSESPNEIAKVCEKLLKNNNLRRLMGKSAQNHIKSNFWTMTQKRFVDTVLR